MSRLNPSLRGDKSAKLFSDLGDAVVGQVEAVSAIVNIYQNYTLGLNNPMRPIANLLLLGPTGTGKTYIVESLAKLLFHNEKAVLKINCAEFQHSHEIAKLVGSPPGYLGHRETHALLSTANLRKYHTEMNKVTLVLFDEIEKANDALWNLLLGITDQASLTTGDNTVTDFSTSIIFMTSNLGADSIDNLFSTTMGFAPASREIAGEKVERIGVTAARRKFTPEFFNRLDKVIVFNPLSKEQLTRILDLELAKVQARFYGVSPCVIEVTDSAKAFLLEVGTDRRYGARPLKRVLETHLVTPISNLIASSQLDDGIVLRVSEVAGELVFDSISTMALTVPGF